MENGDVITAQQWLNGRELKASDMNRESVAKLLRKIHSSKPLLGMLTRMGKSPLQPETLLHLIEEELDCDLKEQAAVIQSVDFLKKKFRISAVKKIRCATAM